jgi:diphosphomevalonate decarboxylase
MNRVWRAQAPSNIALIKYMGKVDAGKNTPTNTSLSYSLEHLRSIVTLETSDVDQWQPLLSDEGRRLEAIELSEKGRSRFLNHLSRIKKEFAYEGGFLVRSANDFPADCGLASSASSFAALTMAALDALSVLTGREAPTRAQAAGLSRMGSGSSCRSFFTPWAVWSRDGEVRGVTAEKLGHLLHQVVIVDEGRKQVSSSEAHLRVSSSALFCGRPERAEERAVRLERSLVNGDWRDAFEICWAEFWDMHALFETSQPSFGYMTAGSLEVLRLVRSTTWDAYGDGPLVTMDAGANIHLLYRSDNRGVEVARALAAKLEGRFRMISSDGLTGAAR